MKFTDELKLLLKARYPIIYINTIEEDRVEYIIRKSIKTSLNRSIYSWDFVDGYTNNPNNEGFAKRNPVQALELVERLTAQTPALFLLKDFNRFLTDVSISRKLKNISRILKLQPKTIIIIGSELNIPKELSDLITILQFQLPVESEINYELKRLIELFKTDQENKLKIAQIFQHEYQKKFAIKSGKVNLRDNRIKRIKLASLAYFIAEDEISFYGLHWDLQQYRRSREIGFTGYPLKPYPKPKSQNRRRNTPKYLLRTTPNYLIGAVLIKKELEKLKKNMESYNKLYAEKHFNLFNPIF